MNENGANENQEGENQSPLNQEEIRNNNSSQKNKVSVKRSKKRKILLISAAVVVVLIIAAVAIELFRPRYLTLTIVGDPKIETNDVFLGGGRTYTYTVDVDNYNLAEGSYSGNKKTWDFILNYARNRSLIAGERDSVALDFYAGRRHIGDEKYLIAIYSYDGWALVMGGTNDIKVFVDPSVSELIKDANDCALYPRTESFIIYPKGRGNSKSAGGGK